MYKDPSVAPRDFNRAVKENIDFYLNTFNKEDYHIMFSCVGLPETKFIELKGKDAEEFIKYIRHYFSIKMNMLS